MKPRQDIWAPNYLQERLPLLSAVILHKSYGTETFAEEEFGICLYQVSMNAVDSNRHIRVILVPTEFVCDNNIIVNVMAASLSVTPNRQTLKWDTLYGDDLRDILRATIQWAAAVKAYRMRPHADMTFPSSPFRPMTLQVLRNGITIGYVAIEKRKEHRTVNLARESVGARPAIASENVARRAAWPTYQSGAVPAHLGPTSQDALNAGSDSDMRSPPGPKRPRLSVHQGTNEVPPLPLANHLNSGDPSTLQSEQGSSRDALPGPRAGDQPSTDDAPFQPGHVEPAPWQDKVPALDNSMHTHLGSSESATPHEEFDIDQWLNFDN